MARLWGKFHPLYESDLKVGLETTFQREEAQDIDPSYKLNGLVHDVPEEPIVRVYEPAAGIIAPCRNSKAAHVFFEPISSDKAKYRRLVFTRKVNRRDKKPWNWTVAARHGEIAHFGFDSKNSKSERYLPLAYSGNMDDSFVPVYFKIQDSGFVYLEVHAFEEGSRTVIQRRRVTADEVPKILREAVPYSSHDISALKNF